MLARLILAVLLTALALPATAAMPCHDDAPMIGEMMHHAPAVPDHLAEEMVNTVNGLQVYKEELAKNTTEQTRLRAEFDADINRFKELKGIK